MTAMIWFDARSAIAGANQAVNTWHVGTAGSGFDVTSTNAVLAAVKPFYDAYAAYRQTGTTFLIGSRVLVHDTANWIKPTFDSNGKKLTDGRWATPPTIIGATSVSSTSGSGGGLVPPQLAHCIGWRTAQAGRNARGRTYLGNLASTAMASGNILGAFVVSQNTAATNLIAAVKAVTVAGGGTAYLGVWSPTRGELREILTGSGDSTFDTMRSRAK